MGEMQGAVIHQVLQHLEGTRGAVIDIERSPYGLKLTATDCTRQSFMIECRFPFKPLDHVDFTYRLVKELADRAPAILVNNALLPANPKSKAFTEVFFQLNEVNGPYRTSRLHSEFGLFEHLYSLRPRRTDELLSDAVAAAFDSFHVQAGFRTHDKPFPSDHAPVTPAQLRILSERCSLWFEAVGPQIKEVLALLKGRRRSTPLAPVHTPIMHGQAAMAVDVPALLPLTAAFGSDFLSKLIERERLVGVSSAVRQATLPQVEAHVAAMKAKLEAGRPGILDWLDKHQHAQEWPMPRQMMGSIMGDQTVAALGYWQHSQEVVGPAGRYSAAEYGARIGDLGLTNALRLGAIKTSVACPSCAGDSTVTVIMMPTATSLGAWSIECHSCGHTEAVNAEPGQRLSITASALTCGCNACTERGDELFKSFGATAKGFSARMDLALVDAAERLENAAPGWALERDDTVRFGDGLAGHYSEAIVAASGTNEPMSWYQSLPHEVKEHLQGNRSYSTSLEHDYGFVRELSYCAMPAFDSSGGSGGWLHTYSLARAGFDAQDPKSFRSWASAALSFALGGTLRLPVLVTVREPSRSREAAT